MSRSAQPAASLLCHIRKQHCEFVAADTGEHATSAKPLFQLMRQTSKHSIPSTVPE